MDNVLKVGDKVRRINGGNEGLEEGDTGVLIGFKSGGSGYSVKADKDGFIYGGDIGNLKLIKSNNNNMNIVNKFKEVFLSEPEKTFRKAGITTDGGVLTEEGTQIFLSWLLNKNGTAFKTEVVDVLLECDKTCK